MLEVPASMKRYPDFRRFVLEKAHKDISKTTFFYEWEPIKQGRTVVAIRFIFNKREVKEFEFQKKIKETPRRNKHFLLALSCSQGKKLAGVCNREDNIPEVCAICRRLNMLE